jgi:hypothetical protein
MRMISRGIERGLGFRGRARFCDHVRWCKALVGLLALRLQGPGFGVRLVRWALVRYDVNVLRYHDSYAI